MIRVYAARAMTNQLQSEVVKQAKEDKAFFESCGIEVFCPVTKEKIKPLNKKLQADLKHMELYWPADKRMIRDAHVFVNFSPHIASMGVIREYGYARYHLQKKVISIFPEGQIPKAGSIAFFEDDEVTDSRIMAVESILRTHGTYWLRLQWRFKKLIRCFPKSFWYQFQEWFK